MLRSSRRIYPLAAILLALVLLVGAAVPVAAESLSVPAAMTLMPEATVINMGDYMSLTGTVTDAQGLPVAGAAIHFFSSLGSPISPNPVYTGADGTYSATYRTGWMPGTDFVTAQVEGTSLSAGAAIQIIMVGPAYSALLTLSQSSVTPSAAVTVTGVLQDAMGNGIGHRPVQLSATGGSFAVSTVMTGVDGSFTAAYTAPETGGLVTITASDPMGGWVLGSATLQVWAVAPANITLVPEANVVGMMDYLSLTGKVIDAQGQPVAGVPVSFSSNFGGWFMPGQATTGADGTYTATWYTGFMAGPVTLTARVPGTAVAASATVQEIIVGLPTNVTFTMADKFVTKSNTVTVTGKMTDANGNGIGHRWIQLAATEGSFAAPAVMTAVDGSFTAVYTAPDAVGEVVVTASAPGLPVSGSFKLHVTPLDHPEHPLH